MGKHSKEKIKNKKKLILDILQVILVIVIIYSLVQIGKWYFNNKKSKAIIQKISDAIIIDTYNDNNEVAGNTYNINFELLKEENQDTVGFLKVNGTDIEYPVVKSNDNDFYLNHTFDKTYNSVGWIFADYRNKVDGTDRNTIIYGHNRRDGSMFYTLKNVLNETWYKNQENLKIQFVTEYGNEIYEVFSVYQIEAEDYYIKTEFNNNEEYLKFLQTIKERSKNNFNIELTAEDRILTLSTCANNNKYRVVLHAKKFKLNNI